MSSVSTAANEKAIMDPHSLRQHSFCGAFGRGSGTGKQADDHCPQPVRMPCRILKANFLADVPDLSMLPLRLPTA